MDELMTLETLRRRGQDWSEVRRLVARDELERVRRGVYRAADPDPGPRPEDTHRRLVQATVPLVSGAAVLSHGSAAVLHGLPVWPTTLDRVHVTRDRRGGGRTRTNLRTHVAPLEVAETVLVEGLCCTDLARTVVDLARSVPSGQAVAAADHALALGETQARLERAARRAAGWPGVPRARWVAGFADARSGSPGESVSRVRIDEFGLPSPVPQLEIVDSSGALVARTDFGWPELMTVGEFDGRVKYGRLVRPGETAADAVYREKLREDALRDLGWQVVRWTWADLARFAPVADRLLRAFARGRRYA